jgi:hypothetical protein
VSAPAAVLEAEPITVPGVYDIPADVYHRDPIPGGSLSSSGARKLLPPSCPALFKHDRDHGQPPKKVFELGHAAHSLVLGDGPQVVLVDAELWNTNAIKAEVAAHRAAGQVPLKRAEYEQVHAMAASLRANPYAAALLAPGSGTAEQSLFWVDGPSGVTRRARLDWLPHPHDGRMIIPDYKTCASAAPDDLQKAMHNYGYHIQSDTYRAGAVALGRAGKDVAMVFICQEKTPPYLVTVFEPDVVAQRIGRDINRQALETFRTCTETGVWPGYSNEIEQIPLPLWVERQYEEKV